MALTSVFYDGVVTETDRAKNRTGSADYGVYGVGDFEVKAHPSIPYNVLVKAGRAHGHGVTDTAAGDQVVPCNTLASGTRWDLIVVRRNWQPALGGPSTLVAISGGTTAAIPGARKVGPGVEDDQPIALVKWQGGLSAPAQIIDLRVWSSNGGLYAKDDLVRSYLDKVGTEVTIGGASWTYKLGQNDVPGWEKSIPAQVKVSGGSGTPWIQAGEVYAVTTAYSTGRVVFDEAFPNACRGITLTSSTASLTAVTFKITSKAKDYVEFVAYGPSGAGLPSSGLYVNYIAAGY